MKILLAGQAYFREDNGQAVFTVRLARELGRRNHRVMVLAPSEDGRTGDETGQGVELWRIRTTRLPHNVNISTFPEKAVSRALDKFAPDIIHLQDHYFISRAVFQVTRKLAIPTVGSNHFLPENLTANLPVPGTLKHPLNWLLWSHMLSLYNKLAAVSTPTKTAADILRSRNIRPRVTPISCGVDTSRFHPCEQQQRRQLRKRFGFSGDGPVFVYVGRLDREKGLDTVVRAFARIDRPGCRLVIAGKGSFQGRLEKLCDQLELQDRVSFPGFMSDTDLPCLLNAADCFVMAGFAELQSIATLEAMACGLPVVAADARALPELVGHGENGLLFKTQDVASLTDALTNFLDSESHWQLWSHKSRSKAEQHGLEKSVTRYLDWYINAIVGNVLSDTPEHLCVLTRKRQLETAIQHLDPQSYSTMFGDSQREGATK